MAEPLRSWWAWLWVLSSVYTDFTKKHTSFPGRSFRETSRSTARVSPPSSTCVRSSCMTVMPVPPRPSVTPSSRPLGTWTGGGGTSVQCPWKGDSSELGCSYRQSKQKQTIKRLHSSSHSLHPQFAIFHWLESPKIALAFWNCHYLHVIGNISRHSGNRTGQFTLELTV